MLPTTLIYPARFDKKRNKWDFAQNLNAKVTADVLTLATFNTWFGEYHFTERIRSITELLRGSNADIIALQEITTTSLELLLKEEWIKDDYVISDISGTPRHFPFGSFRSDRQT